MRQLVENFIKALAPSIFYSTVKTSNYLKLCLTPTTFIFSYSDIITATAATSKSSSLNKRFAIKCHSQYGCHSIFRLVTAGLSIWHSVDTPLTSIQCFKFHKAWCLFLKVGRRKRVIKLQLKRVRQKKKPYGQDRTRALFKVSQLFICQSDFYGL